MTNKIEEDFEDIKKQVSDKMREADKLLREANELADKKLHCTLYGADESAFEDLQGTMEDLGFVIEHEEGWNSSGCYNY